MHKSCRQAFAGLNVFTVGVTCPLEILEAREKSRGDRVLGRARGLADVVHTICDYDIVIDTGTTDTRTCVQNIIAAVQPADH
jgi:chloramphenicol 3-O phosphotransferase